MLPDNLSHAITANLAIIVKHTRREFVGVQNAAREHHMPAYVLLDHPIHGSTLALRLDEFWYGCSSPRLAECDKRFESHR
jgi:hypothetical protein